MTLPAVRTPAVPDPADEAFLEELGRHSFEFFRQETDPRSGLTPDRVRATGGARGDVSSIAGVGFGLAGLCIAEQRGWMTRNEVLVRVRTTLRFAIENVDHERGFFYHFLDTDSGKRVWQCEVSPIDTSLFLCGALVARQHFPDDPVIAETTKELYERIDWPWMLNGGQTLALGWSPGQGFSRHRWEGYAEHMAMYLLGLGSPTHPLPPRIWRSWRREPVGTYGDFTYIQYPPLFVHQYAHAFVDFRDLADDHANYWSNSVLATRAQRQMCMDRKAEFPGYGPNLWGVTASDGPNGYVAWGGPPATTNLDGTVVPCAAGGSIPFLPRECIDALRTMKERHGRFIWGKYGFVDAFNPTTGWVAEDVLAIDAGITLVQAENHRSGLVWNRFMANPEIQRAMKLAGFRPSPPMPANCSLMDPDAHKPPARTAGPRHAVARAASRPEAEWDWQTMTVADSRESVTDGDGLVSMKFAFAWDDTSLHFRAVVTDPAPANERDAAHMFLEDSVELFLDPGNDGLVWASKLDAQFGFALNDKTHEWFGNRRAIARVQPAAGGYRITALIPWKELGLVPRAGLQLGVSPAVNSIRADDESPVKLNWRWREERGVFHLGTLTLEQP